MKILVLSFYYSPDLSAGSFRTTPLVAALAELLPAGSELHVVTTLPNRYRSFSVDVPALERHGAVTIHRIALPPHRSGMVDQARAFVAYALGVWRIVRREKYSLVFATSSRLMTAALGSWVSRRLCAPLYLDLRDIFVDTIKDVLPGFATTLAGPALSLLERYTITRAAKVNLVSEGFGEYFRGRYPNQTYSFYTNGIDDEFLEFDWTTTSAASATGGGERTVLYAGNIGEGQGLHEIIPELARRTSGRLRFRIIGDGGRRRELEAGIAARGVSNVTMLPPMNRRELLAEYRDADVLFLHLNDHDAFRKVLPSKVFEYAATGKPIWAGIAGYSAEFLRAHVDNAVVFAPCDPDEALAVLSRLDPGSEPRTAFVSRFSRDSISRALAADVINEVRA